MDRAAMNPAAPHHLPQASSNHAALLRLQALILPVRTLVLSGGR